MRRKCPYFNCTKPACIYWKYATCGVLCRNPPRNQKMSLIASVKNKAASLTLRAFLNQHVSRYAELRDVHVDLAKKSVLVNFTPKGEKTHISIDLGYDVVREISGLPRKVPALRVTGAESSRRWITLAAQDHLVGKEFDIPPAVAKFL